MWTNQSLRAELGQRGFLQTGRDRYEPETKSTYTDFHRGLRKVTLVETEGKEPHVELAGVWLDVMEFGYRNDQIQHDKQRGD